MSANWLHPHSDQPGPQQTMSGFTGEKLVVAGGSSGMGRDAAGLRHHCRPPRRERPCVDQRQRRSHGASGQQDGPELTAAARRWTQFSPRGVGDRATWWNCPYHGRSGFHAQASRERAVDWVIPLCFMGSRFLDLRARILRDTTESHVLLAARARPLGTPRRRRGCRRVGRLRLPERRQRREGWRSASAEEAASTSCAVPTTSEHDWHAPTPGQRTRLPRAAAIRKCRVGGD
jgi:hypothetical protein